MVTAARHPRPLAALAFLLFSACSGGSDDGTSGPVPVASISVSPTQVTVAVGSEAQLTAETRAADGAILTGRTVSWVSGDQNIATVTATGLVRGVAAGNTQVTAASEGRTAIVPVTVTPPPAASVVITPNPAGVAVGQSVQLTATARDTGGSPIAGKTFAWSSSNPSVANVDQTGRVSGLAAGSATVTAAVDNVSGSAVVNVSPPAAVVVTAITPATLVEGQAATLTGSGFGTTPAANRVTIDGVQAQVTAATGTSLQIVVPAFDCRPRRTAPVQVVVGAGSSTPINHAVAPASFLNLTVGQQVVLQGSADRCLQFDASVASQRFVFGVQSISEAASTVTGVTVSGVVPTGSLVPPALPLPAPGVTAGGLAPSARDIEAAERWNRHIEASVAGYERERLLLQPMADRGALRRDPTHCLGNGCPLSQWVPLSAVSDPPAAVPTVPGTVQEGDQLTVRFNQFGGNSCTQFTDITVRVREISSRGIFVEDVANPVQLAQSAWDQAASDFAVIHDIDVDHFGAPGDVDSNQRVVIVVTREVNRLASPPLAFVAHANLFPVAQCPASNEGEFFFMRAPDPTGQFQAGVYALNTMLEDIPHLLAHEFAHIIQGARRMAVNGQFMTSWLAEGLATAAQEVAGFQVVGLQNGQNYGRNRVYNTLGADPRDFFTYMTDLIAYFGFDFGPAQGARRAGAPEECGWVGEGSGGSGNPGPCAFATRILYGLPWSVIKMAIDRHHGGATGQKAILRAFSDRNGPPGFADLEAVLGRPITQLITEWSPMLYLDDRFPAAGFQLANWNLRDITAAWNSPNAELAPRMRTFSSFADAFNVRASSAGYYDISGANRPATAIRVRNALGATLPSFMVVWVVRVQ